MMGRPEDGELLQIFSMIAPGRLPGNPGLPPLILSRVRRKNRTFRKDERTFHDKERTMPTVTVIGAQWGDEGKGRVIDLLAATADVVVRSNGGSNAGHSVENDLGRFALAL